MVRRGTLPIYPIHLTLNYPGAFNKRLSLKLLVLKTQIPVACVGVLTILGHALKFSHVPLHGFVAGTRGSLGRNSPLPIPNNGTPGHYTASEPTSSLNWGVPSLATPPQCPRGVLAPWDPFRGSPVPSALPPWHTASRAPHQRVTRAHYAIPASHEPLAYRGRLARCPGYPLSDTHRS